MIETMWWFIVYGGMNGQDARHVGGAALPKREF